MLHVLGEVLRAVVPRAPRDAPEACVRVRLLREDLDLARDVLPEVGVLQPALQLGLVAGDVRDVLVGVGDPDLDDALHGRQRAASVVQAAKQLAHRRARVRRLVEPCRAVELVQQPGLAEVEAVAGGGHAAAELHPRAKPCPARNRMDPVIPARERAECHLRDGVDVRSQRTDEVVLRTPEERVVGGLRRDRDVVVGAGRRVVGERAREQRPVDGGPEDGLGVQSAPRRGSHPQGPAQRPAPVRALPPPRARPPRPCSRCPSRLAGRPSTRARPKGMGRRPQEGRRRRT